MRESVRLTNRQYNLMRVFSEPVPFTEVLRYDQRTVNSMIDRRIIAPNFRSRCFCPTRGGEKVLNLFSHTVVCFEEPRLPGKRLSQILESHLRPRQDLATRGARKPATESKGRGRLLTMAMTG